MPRFRNRNHVLDAHAKLTRKINAGFHRYHHAGARRRFVAWGESGPFVNFHADSVPRAVAERTWVVLFNDIPRRFIY